MAHIFAENMKEFLALSILVIALSHQNGTEGKFRSRDYKDRFVEEFFIKVSEERSQESGKVSPHNYKDFPFRNVSLPWAERVKDLVSRLTLEEIQLQMAKGGAGVNGGPAPAIPRLGIGPYQWNTECLRGDAEAPRTATAFPQSIGLAAAFSTDLLFRVAEAAAVEVRGNHNEFVKDKIYKDHTGASCFAPMINIMRDARWGRNQETYGEDPYLTGVLAQSYIRGLQGNDSRYVRASSGCKAFDAYAGPENIPSDRMYFDAKISMRDLRMTYLPAFRKCVEAGTFNMMCSYNSINGVPSCANKWLLTDVLRTEWNFTGYVVSDESAIENIIHDHHYLSTSVDTVAACVNAGCNLELSGHDVKTAVYLSLVEAVTQGKVSEDLVRERLSPLFYTRMRLGEFDPPALNPYNKLSDADVETPAHQQLAVEAALKSFVLLKNDNATLPFNTPLGSIGVVGPMANDTTQIMGDYNPVPSPGKVVAALAGLREVGEQVKYAPGCHSTTCFQLNDTAIYDAVTGTDVNFVLVGTGSLIESEGNDRRDLELPGKQKELVLNVLKYAPATPVVLVVFSAGPVNISFADADPRIKAIIQAFFPAQATGTALKHMLMNDVPGSSPAARTPYTWPLYLSQLPGMVNYSMAGRTYRYMGGQVLYPFGFGLSYSTFSFSALSAPRTVQASSDLTGHVTVTNTGTVTCDEVVQVYISWMNQSLPAPVRQLAWFDRVTVAAGGSVSVQFTVDAQTMALWLTHSWEITAGDMMLYVGGQQPGQQKQAPSNVLSQPFTILGSTQIKA